MSITIDNETFLSRKEVDNILSTLDLSKENQWEKHELTYESDFGTGWNLKTFMVNKHTGAVTGILGINKIYDSTSSTILTSSTDLARHSGMRLGYCEIPVYNEVTSTASIDTTQSARNFNITVNTSGKINTQGEPSRTEMSTHLSNFFYIGSKYGDITTEDISVIYKPEGTFYNANTVKLLTGKSWLRYDVELPEGYSTSSYLSFFKNLWSGEVVTQYSLYCSTENSWPTITIPNRFRVYGDQRMFIKPRYMTPSSTAVQNKERAWMQFTTSDTISFSIPSGTTWVTGSHFYVGKTESPDGTYSETADGLWFPEGGEIIPSAVSTSFSSLGEEINQGNVNLDTGLAEGYAARSSYPSFITRSRTGMVYLNLDVTLTKNAINIPVTSGSWSQRYRPSIHYRPMGVTGSISVYFGSPAYIHNTAVTTAIAGTSYYRANVRLYTNATSSQDDATSKAITYGNTGNISPTTGNPMIFQGWFLSDET